MSKVSQGRSLVCRLSSCTQWYGGIEPRDFTWTVPDTNFSTQLTWTVLPQGFRDSPHLFGQALASDLLLLSLPKSKLIQYMDDILLCSPSLEIRKTDTVALLNFLSKRGYRVSPSKVQLSTTQFLPPKKKFYRSWECPAFCAPESPSFLSLPAPYMKQLSALCMSTFSIWLPNPSKDSNGSFSRLQLLIFWI